MTITCYVSVTPDFKSAEDVKLNLRVNMKNKIKILINETYKQKQKHLQQK